MAQRLSGSGRPIFRAMRHLGGTAQEGCDATPSFRALALANLKRKASNSFSAIQDTFFSTKEVFENHRVVFTIGTSIASILTAWAGYSLRQYHQSNVERRLKSIEKADVAEINGGRGMEEFLYNCEFAMMKSYNAEHDEIKRIVSSGNVSTTVCIASVGTSLIIGYGLGWRSGLWFANRKFRKEQLKLMGQVKPRGWQILRSFVRFQKNCSRPKIAELSANAPTSVSKLINQHS